MNKSCIQSLQDRFANLSEEWTLACEIFGNVQTQDLALSPKALSGLANYTFALCERIETFEEQLGSVTMTRPQRFARLVHQSPIMSEYYDDAKGMMRIEAIWKDFETLPKRNQVMLTFMLLVWHPIEHRYPPIETFSVLQDIESLTESDKKIIADWMDSPFLVVDDNGNVIDDSE